ncbi:hypothetical protein [Tsuneonella sp. HG222]
MRKLLACAAVIALAACNNAETADADADASAATTEETAAASGVLEGEAPGFEAVAPGTYQVTRSGGEMDYIEIHPGMTFSRVAADGSATGGSIFMKGGKTCFVVEGQEQESCFTDSAPDANGVVKATAANGDVATIKPVEGALEDHVPAQG